MFTVQETPTGLNRVRALIERLAPDPRGAIARLEWGVEAVELGCGFGAVLLTLAAAFPRSRFTGLDDSAEAVAGATRVAQERRLDNVAFRRVHEGATPQLDAFDLVIRDGAMTWR